MRIAGIIGYAAACLVFACGGCKGSDDRSADGKPASWITIDGKADDWTHIRPLISEAGSVGRGRSNGIDIKQVYFASDRDYLYAFLRCSPTIRQRFAEDQTTDQFCELFLDTDGNPATGCKGVEAFNYGDISGYETKVWIMLLVHFDTRTRRTSPNVGYVLYRPDAKGKFSFEKPVPDSRRSSGDPHALIEHGFDGVELAIPLKALVLEPGATARLLLVEVANSFSRDGYTEATLKLQSE